MIYQTREYRRTFIWVTKWQALISVGRVNLRAGHLKNLFATPALAEGI